MKLANLKAENIKLKSENVSNLSKATDEILSKLSESGKKYSNSLENESVKELQRLHREEQEENYQIITELQNDISVENKRRKLTPGFPSGPSSKSFSRSL